MYDIAKWGDIPEELWVDCVVASNVDPTLAPAGKHIMTCFVQYVPYRLRTGTWDDHRELLGKRVIDIVGRYAPNVPGSIEAVQVLTPLDLERTFGLTEGNIFHGDLNVDQLFFMRPLPAWSRYRTPIDGLYLSDAEADFLRVFVPDNEPGPARERWFHALGCRTWFELTRDATTNRIG